MISKLEQFQEGDADSFLAKMIEPFEKGKECIDINYYGTKRMCEAFIPLLQLSQNPRIVNVSSSAGKLKVKLAKLKEKIKINYHLIYYNLDSKYRTFLYIY